MSDLISAIIIGIVQGLTEFLPVSSSGHIELAQKILGYELGDREQQLSVVLHAATALSTIVIFRKEIAEIFKGLFKFENNEEFQFSLKIVLSMIPAAIVGIVFDKEIEKLFDGNILLVGVMLLLTGALLFLADRAKDTTKKVGFGHSILIGIAQMIALLPGISRSGATISTSVLLGIDRTRAAKFSFLMVIPLILGKMAKDIMDKGFDFTTDMIYAFFAAFFTGLVACVWMISLVKKSKLSYFAYYCFIVGILAIGWSIYKM